MNLEGVLEGLLFLRGDEGVTLKEICKILEVDQEEAKSLLMSLKKSYENESRGMKIRYLGEVFKLTTKEEHKPYFQKLTPQEENQVLSPQALEVLAVIAYNGPLTRVEIDEMRGVSSDYTLRKLISKGLIETKGQSSMPGHPNLYGTTKEFLDYFGLATIKDLPKLEKEEQAKENPELFSSIYKENEE